MPISPERLAFLTEFVNKRIDPTFPLHSRLHYHPNLKLWIKREDELSSSIAGSKYRKFASILPYIKQLDLSAWIGGMNSNNLMAAAQITKQYSLDAHFFVLKPNEEEKKGNALLNSWMFDEGKIHLINRESWPNVDSAARNWLSENVPDSTFDVFSEGSFHQSALAGSLGLAVEVANQSLANQQFFKTLFIDSGTGFTAASLLLGLNFLRYPIDFKICLIAGDHAEFSLVYSKIKEWFSASTGIPLIEDRINVQFTHPPVGKSFGSVSSNILSSIKRVAGNYGLLLDPIYGIKHFMSIESEGGEFKQPGLWVNNSNPLGLLGFHEKLREIPI